MIRTVIEESETKELDGNVRERTEGNKFCKCTEYLQSFLRKY